MQITMTIEKVHKAYKAVACWSLPPKKGQEQGPSCTCTMYFHTEDQIEYWCQGLVTALETSHLVDVTISRPNLRELQPA